MTPPDALGGDPPHTLSGDAEFAARACDQHGTPWGDGTAKLLRQLGIEHDRLVQEVRTLRERLQPVLDYLDDDPPQAFSNVLDRCEANVIRFSNDDVSIVISEYDKLRALCAKALETPHSEGKA
jgi:hypothetical protein